MSKKLYLIVGILLSCSSCQGQDKLNIEDCSIRELVEICYEPGSLYIGGTARRDFFTDPESPVAQRFFKEFSYNTPNNCFKHSQVLKPGTGNQGWNNEEYMYFIQQARETGQVLRAHGPISPQCNHWARGDERRPEELKESLEYYLLHLCRDLEANVDVIKWMDVVNETICKQRMMGIGPDASLSDETYEMNPGDWMTPRKGVRNWENPWPIIGMDTVQFEGAPFVIPKYIEMAFCLAQKYAPHIKKVWNEDGLIVPDDFETFKKAFRYIRSKGIDVDAVAFQGHIKTSFATDESQQENLHKLISWCHEQGVEFHVSELNVAVGERYESTSFNQLLLDKTREQQTAAYSKFLDICLSHVKQGFVAVNFWSFTDSFYETTFGGLFDRQGNALPAYYAVKDLLVKHSTSH